MFACGAKPTVRAPVVGVALLPADEVDDAQSAMKRLVRSRGTSALMFGTIAGMIVILTHASTGAAYLITLGVGMVGFGLTQGHDGPSVWREIYWSWSKAKRRRDGVA
jgi:hypothetical protein